MNNSINNKKENKPSLEDAKKAVETLLKWIGEDPKREGLKNTAANVSKNLKEQCKGLELNAYDELKSSLKPLDCDDCGIIFLRDIKFFSLCEHHLVPMVGFATVAYVPNKSIVGLSALARVVDIYARRPQIQERMTKQIVTAINETLDPKGVAVSLTAEHLCLSSRGSSQSDATFKTIHGLGNLSIDGIFRKQFNLEIAACPCCKSNKN